jgi:hypothetical protein
MQLTSPMVFGPASRNWLARARLARRVCSAMRSPVPISA